MNTKRKSNIRKEMLTSRFMRMFYNSMKSDIACTRIINQRCLMLRPTHVTAFVAKNSRYTGHQNKAGKTPVF